MTTILVVDDEPAIREVLIEFLAEHGFAAQGAEDGSKALALLGTLRPEVILLDVAMPGMNGIETLRLIRKQAPDIAVIMISGHADHQMALEALDLGAYDFIQKPLDFKYLERTLITKLATLEPSGARDAEKEVRHGGARGAGARRR